ncbi:hypothetical protein A3D78_01045 [Candidatus Gottesmanbacteria bacterium RIFCSPHIGHO2_02_FULL_39_14]|uniref:Glycosyltransferase RgtA/B/C/D-like domain-containing protein n=1 Tax=Candidatus Gottesmanbacteria bacterium RIFCSPHIGHO2_02_FULL_39_14 TaxID=1798383 RepID=A0A1F6A009_9BACT|nr:MAG: hypothetical protein A3D78_01045 [Candidatus Gottesmanbacteria bacterium RIFCSPHIGHO2_02_FULL_39_14]
MGRKKIIILIILIISFLLRLVNLNQSFWLDEAAQMIESVRPLKEQFDLAADFHPPLYHILLYFWLKLGTSEIFARLPQVLMGTFSVFLLYKIAGLLKYKSEAFVAALLLAVSPYHIYYSQEVRPYMLFTALSLISSYLFLKQEILFFTLINILLLYTNYFAFFLLLGQLFVAKIFFPNFFFKVLKSQIIAVLFFLPWLPNLFRQLQVGFSGALTGWTDVVSEKVVKVVPLTLAKFIIGKASFDNNLLYALILFPSVLSFAISCWSVRKIKNGRILLAYFLTPFLIIFFISVFFPLVAPQRLIFLLPFFYLIIASNNVVPFKKIYLPKIVVVLLTSLMGLSLYYLNPRFQRENWRQSVEWINKVKKDEPLVVFAFPEPFAPFIWYNRGYLNGIGVARDFRIENKNIPELTNQFSAYDEIYYYNYLSDLTDPDKKVLSVLSSGGFRKVQVKDFPGVGFIYRYEKQPFN